VAPLLFYFTGFFFEHGARQKGLPLLFAEFFRVVKQSRA